MAKDKKISPSGSCSLTLRSLDGIIEAYHVPRSRLPVLPSPEQTVHEPPTGLAGVYHHHLKAGLRFSETGTINEFVSSILLYYRVHLVQVAPNGFRKILCFYIICKLLDISPTVDYFRYFYGVAPIGESFSKRPHAVELCLGLPSSIKNWKSEFFFIKSSAYPGTMQMGVIAARSSDRLGKLSVEGQGVVDRIAANALWWTDPDEVTLGLAGLSPYWDSLNPKPLIVDDGKGITLADRVTFVRDVKFDETVGISSDAGPNSSSSLSSTSRPAAKGEPPSEPMRSVILPTSDETKPNLRKRPLSPIVTSSKDREESSHSSKSGASDTVLAEAVGPKRPCTHSPSVHSEDPDADTAPSVVPASSLVDCQVTSDPLLTSSGGPSPPVVVFSPAKLVLPPASASTGEAPVTDVKREEVKKVFESSFEDILVVPPSTDSVFQRSLFGTGFGSFSSPLPSIVTPSLVASTKLTPLVEATASAGIAGTQICR